MRSLGKIWIWVLALLIVAGGLAVVGAAGNRSSAQKISDMKGRDPALAKVQAESDAALLRQAHEGRVALTAQEKKHVGDLMAHQGHRGRRNPVDNQGGPDGSGYAFVDNVTPDTATFNWIELCGDNNASDGPVDDDAAMNIPIGFSFPFYGTSYTDCYISTNGLITFGGENTAYSADDPTTTLPLYPYVAPFWFDGNTAGGGTEGGCNQDANGPWIRYRSFSTYLVVEWKKMPQFEEPDYATFEAVLYQSGAVEVQFGSDFVMPGVPGLLGNVGVGIDGPGESDGLSYAFWPNQDPWIGFEPAASRAIWFALPNGIPMPVTNLQSSVNGTTVALTWVDPNHDINGNPLIPDSILIYRGDTQQGSEIGHVTHGVQTFTATNQPQGNLQFYVRAKAATWLSQAVSVGAIVGTPGYADNFDVDNGGWVADNGWTWGAPTNPAAPPPHSGSNMWGTGMTTDYPANECDHLDLDPGLLVTSPSATFEFWAWWSLYPFGPYDACNFKVSVDEGVTWQTVIPQLPYFNQPVYSFTACIPNESAWCETSNGWQYVVIPIGQFNGQTPMFRFTFGSYESGYPGFFFDDLTIWGIASPPNGIPRPVTNLQGSANGTTVALTWLDPDHDTNGNPLTPDSILIYRTNAQPSSQIGHVAHGVQTITINNEPAGRATYFARAKAGQYVSLSASVPVLVGSPVYDNNFEVDDGAWVADGGWTWGAPTNPQAPQPHSGSNMWGTGMDANYVANQCNHLDLSPGLEVISPSATIEFWAWWSMYPFGFFDGCNLKVSVDDGNTWQPVTPIGRYPGVLYPFNTCLPGDSAWSQISNGWHRYVVPISQFMGQTPMFRFTFGSYLGNYPGFFFDDMQIWGLHPAQQATVSGTVTLDGGHGAVTGVLIAGNGLGSPTTNPAANGTYTLAGVQVGHRRLTASLANYLPDTLNIILDSTGYTNANFVVRRTPPPAPTNLVSTVMTSARKDSLHWAVSPDTTVDGYRLYRKLATGQTFTLRQNVWGRTSQWVRDTIEADGVYNYAITATDTNMVVPPWSESANSDTATSPFGHLAPINLTADGNFDSHIHLAWNPPSDLIESLVMYDDGINEIDGIGWWGARPSFGWLTSHYQVSGSVIVTGVRAYLTRNATLGAPIQIGVFADDGTGHPAMTPMSVADASVEAPLGAQHEWSLTAPVSIDNGSFFVGIRQMSNHAVCLGGENETSFVTHTFFYSYDGTSWSNWEPNLLTVPMLSAHIIVSDHDAPHLAVGPVAMRTMTSSATFFAKTPATLKALTAPAVSGELGQTANQTSKRIPYSTVPGAIRGGAPHRAWEAAQRLGSAMSPHAPIVVATESISRGRRNRTLDDIVRYLVYKDSVAVDSTVPGATQYDVNNLVENAPHNFYIKARYDDNQLSPASNVVNARCNMAPGDPTNVVAQGVGQTQMRITWVDPTVNADGTPCVDLAGIRIYRDGGLITTTPIAPGVQQYTDTPPDPHQVYTWTAKAIDEVPNEGPGGSASGSVISPWHSIEYNWMEISSNGTNTGLTQDDENVGPFNLGFSFPFYGQTYSSIHVCSNGWASFTDATDLFYWNQPIPSNLETPYCALMPYWDDLYLPSGGAVFYLADAVNQRFIIEWQDVPHIGTGGPYTFEVILDPTGGVTYQYQTIHHDTDTSATVGVENCDNTDAVQVCFDSAGVWCPQDGQAIQFWGGPRQAIDGTVHHIGGSNPVLPGTQVWVTGRPDTLVTDDNGFFHFPLDTGRYTVHFHHPTHCDSVVTNVLLLPNQDDTLNVGLNSPRATVSITSLTFVVHRYLTQPQTFTVSDSGGACPLMFQVQDSVAWLTSNPAADTLAPNQTATITVTAAPGAIQPGEYQTTMLVVCNAPGSPFLIHVDMNVLSVDPLPGGIPTEFALHANYPNPFNPTTLLPFDVPRESQVDIVIYNIMGQEVARPVTGKYAAGRYQVNFDAGALPSGVYLVKMKAGSFSSVGKMMLLK